MARFTPGAQTKTTSRHRVALFDKVSPGGFVIVDDYGAWEPCRKAVDDFRAQHGITDEVVEVDWTGVYWRKS